MEKSLAPAGLVLYELQVDDTLLPQGRCTASWGLNFPLGLSALE
jgi:hypothetical protein